MTACFKPQKVIRLGTLIASCLFAFSCSLNSSDAPWTKTFNISQKADIGAADGSVDVNKNVITLWQQTSTEERADPANANLTENDPFTTFYRFSRNTLHYSYYDASSKLWNTPPALQGGTWVETHTLRKINGTEIVSSSENSGTLPATNPQVRMDSNGNAIAVWQRVDSAAENPVTTCNNESSQIQCSPVISSIWTSRFTASSVSWSTPVILDTSANTANNVALELDNANNALAVWRQWDNTSSAYLLFVSHYSVSDDTWTAPALVSDAGIDIQSFKLTVDGLNNAFIVWQSTDHGLSGFTLERIYAKRYAAGAWETASTVISNDTGNASKPSISTDNAGNAWLSWQQTNTIARSSTTSIWANRFNIDSASWETAGLVESSDLPTQNPNIHAANAAIIAAWEQQDPKDLDRNNDTEVINIYMSVYDANTSSWGAATLLEDDNVYDATLPIIYTQPNNGTIITWQQYQNPVNNSGFALFSKTYSPSSGLSATSIITSGGQITNSNLLISGSNTVALWEEQANTSGIVQGKFKK